MSGGVSGDEFVILLDGCKPLWSAFKMVLDRDVGSFVNQNFLQERVILVGFVWDVDFSRACTSSSMPIIDVHYLMVKSKGLWNLSEDISIVLCETKSFLLVLPVVSSNPEIDLMV